MAEEIENPEVGCSSDQFPSPRGESKRRKVRKEEEKRSNVTKPGREDQEFSQAEIESLIQSAMYSAGLQGRDTATSQSWADKVQETVAGHLAALPTPFKVEDLGGLLSDVLDILESEDVCRSWSTAGSKSIFPLPVTGIERGDHPSNPFLQALSKGLNSLFGQRAPVGFTGNKNSVATLKRLAETLTGQPLLETEVPSTTFHEYCQFKGVDYLGEEIRLARRVTWESIEPSLPSQVATLDLQEFCSGGVLHYVRNFLDYLIAPENRVDTPSPRVMVDDSEWDRVSSGLVSHGLCQVLPREVLVHGRTQPVFNGLFCVSKQEFVGDVEVCRLIMNLKPTNAICLGLTGDTSTLPAISTMTGFYLQEEEVLCMSSEDIRCFFYLFKVPWEWVPCFAFGKEVPSRLVPEEFKGSPCYLCSRVLPMGFLNSVAIAQHVHRNVIKKCLGSFPFSIGGEAEIRRDRVAPEGNDLYRIYLDNFDEMRKVDVKLAQEIEGQLSPLVTELREVYQEMGLPIHPKKSLAQKFRGEIQGAWVDGEKGFIMAKPSKIVKYIGLALELIRKCKASQKELQIVGGGLVYASMFRRPSLCGLNHIWRAIVSLDGKPRGLVVNLKREVVLELARFITLMPLLFINLRAPFDEAVTASDASTSGGGVCVTRGLTPYAAEGMVRGEQYEEPGQIQVLSVGLFDGVSALRVALDGLQAPMVGHISVEKQGEARRVVEAFFPDTLFVEDVELIDDGMVRSWSLRFGSAGLVLIGSGPPCQGVSGLNADRRGALRDHRSKLFHHVPRVGGLIRKYFPWCQVQSLTENVASMDTDDCQHMCDAFEDYPWLLDAGGISLARRPRIYWVSWEIHSNDDDVEVSREVEHHLPIQGEIKLTAQVNEKEFLEPGWKLMSEQKLPTFTTARPSENPLRRPAGLKQCQEHEVVRWKRDSHRFPPYQYRDVHCLHHASGEARPPSVLEREVILGFPAHYTKQCMSKQWHDTAQHRDCRLSLLGNSWSVPVVAWLLQVLLCRLGIVPPLNLRQLLDRFSPGKSPSFQGILLRPSLAQSTSTLPLCSALPRKLFGLTSLKGEDLLVHGDSEPPLRYHRLRTSVPSKLWRWKPITGWQWKSSGEHINSLEMRAVYTSIRWRVEQLQQHNCRCVHLVDSLVVLHSLGRGRSSSRKLMRTVMKINSLLLVTGLHALWGYVDTKQNPADRPSRWGGSRRWEKKRVK